MKAGGKSVRICSAGGGFVNFLGAANGLSLGTRGFNPVCTVLRSGRKYV